MEAAETSHTITPKLHSLTNNILDYEAATNQIFNLQLIN